LVRPTLAIVSKVQKIHVKMTFKVTDEDRENFKTDVPIVNQLLNRKPGDQLDKSKIVRAAIRDLHLNLQKGIVPEWLKDSPEASTKSKTRSKK
jgi:hypothetical protein